MNRFSAIAGLLAVVLSACVEAPPLATPSKAPPRVTAAPASAAPSVAAATAAAAPPAAPIRMVTDVYFGVTVADPYRWMEQDSPELSPWMKAQSSFTRAALDALPARAALLARLQQLDASGDEISDVSRHGGRPFYLKRARGSEVGKLCVRDATGGPERVLVDPRTLASAGEHLTIDYFTPSPDGRRVAYGLSASGSEDSVLYVLETATGKVLPDRLERAQFGSPSWLDGERFFTTRLQKLASGAPTNDRFKKTFSVLHTLGKSPDDAPRLIGAGVSPAVPMRDDQIGLTFASAGGKYAISLVADGVRNEQELHIAPRSALAGPKTPWKKIVDRDRDQAVWFETHDDDLILLSHRGAPRFKVIKTSLTRPDLERPTVLVPESDLVLKQIAVARDALYVTALDAGIGRLLRVPHRGGPVERIALPVEGTIEGLSADAGEDGALFQLQSWTLSPHIYAFDPKAGKVVDTQILAPSAADFSAVVAEEVQAKSADGTSVPLSIVHLGSFLKDGSHPTWLKGYGAYGRSELPKFVPGLLAWLEKGGVYAVCHARGGGELGEAWHRDGMLLDKQHTIDDFLGCARHLIEQKYTSPAKLAGEGSSAGGITIGGALTQRPDLFGAALIRVGVSNVLRFEQTQNVFQAPEFGTVHTEEGWKALRLADAYTHVKDGTRYPAVLLTTGLTDARVAPWQATKMTARLQAATASGKPVLLRVADDAGHGQGSTRTQEDEELADEYAFLLWQLDALPAAR